MDKSILKPNMLCKQSSIIHYEWLSSSDTLCEFPNARSFARHDTVEIKNAP